MTDQVQWAEWMQRFGRQTRRVRESVGLSQDELARVAGVSQGAVSRLENGRGVATPFVVVLKVNGALARELRKLDPSLLDERLQRAIVMHESIAPAVGNDTGDGMPIFRERYFGEVLDLLRSVPERQKPLCVAMVRALVGALSDGPTD